MELATSTRIDRIINFMIFNYEMISKSLKYPNDKKIINQCLVIELCLVILAYNWYTALPPLPFFWNLWDSKPLVFWCKGRNDKSFPTIIFGWQRFFFCPSSRRISFLIDSSDFSLMDLMELYFLKLKELLESFCFFSFFLLRLVGLEVSGLIFTDEEIFLFFKGFCS